MEAYWEIKAKKIDSTAFFRALLKYFPEATTFYAEGTVIEKDVVECYLSHAQEGQYLPPEGTTWPESEKFRCRFSLDLMNALAQLSEHHAEPELLTHLFLYRDHDPLLEWYDAFADPILVSPSVPEEAVSGLASELGVKYGKEKSGKQKWGYLFFWISESLKGFIRRR